VKVRILNSCRLAIQTPVTDACIVPQKENINPSLDSSVSSVEFPTKSNEDSLSRNRTSFPFDVLSNYPVTTSELPLTTMDLDVAVDDSEELEVNSFELLIVKQLTLNKHEASVTFISLFR
jgi:hypothetical protein